ncbi:MAG: phosphotransferase family protein [Candidatus Hodarchaeota archaeon]
MATLELFFRETTSEANLMVCYEETNPQDVPPEVVETVLSGFFPKIRRKEAVFLYHGTYNVFEVKQQYIFRFPDKSFFNRKGFDLIHRENEALNLLRSYFSFEVPQFLYLPSDPQLPFVGYKKIPGVSLSRCFNKATSDKKMGLAKQLGRFLSELHSPEVYQAFTAKWPTEFTPSTYRSYIEKFYLEIRNKLYSHFSPAQKKWTTNLFTNFLEDLSNFRFIPRVTHRDLDTTNILVDPVSFRVTGIIDFEEVAVWDPAQDFPFYDEGLDFLEQVLVNYSGSVGSNFQQRLHYVWNRVPLIYLLTGLELKYSRMIEAGFEMLKEKMKTSH